MQHTPMSGNRQGKPEVETRRGLEEGKKRERLSASQGSLAVITPPVREFFAARLRPTPKIHDDVYR